MKLAAKLLAPLAAILFFGACGHLAPLTPTRHPSSNGAAPPPPAPAPPSPDALSPSPHPLVGRVLAVDAAQGFAFVALTAAPPAAALTEGALLVSRADDLGETARLRASRYLRGRTLGAKIISGQPRPGDEVVLAPP